MTRCSICDCSQSADSIYHNSVTSPGSSIIRYVRKFDEFICNECRQSILDQKNYWREVDGDATDFNLFEASSYEGEPVPRDPLEAD